MTPRSEEREGVGVGGRLPSSRHCRAPPLAPGPPLISAPAPRPARAAPAASATPPARPQHPQPHPLPAAAPRVIFIRNIPKSVPLAQAEPRAELALISGPRLLPSGRAGGGGVGEGWVGGWGGWEGGSKPPHSALGEPCRSSEAATLCVAVSRPPGLPPARRLG